jgi:glutathione synthase/RimK-type ligase-like ATP-grasp enzyme
MLDMTIKIAPYNPGSRSARALSEALGCRRLKVDGFSRWQPRSEDIVINWGRSDFGCFNWVFEGPWPRVINGPFDVSKASCKRETLIRLRDNNVKTLPFTEVKQIAEEWQQEGHTIIARTLLRANSGRGIVKCEPEVDIPNAPLYTKYVRKLTEWRVHVAGGRVIDIQRKIARPGSTPTDWNIRNHANGFIFQRDYNREVWHDEIGDEALLAVDALGLDFGAVDIAWASGNTLNGDISDCPVVFEVNTAPGLEGTTLENYRDALLHL